jgi:Mg-chelatase subunit ChlD
MERMKMRFVGLVLLLGVSLVSKAQNGVSVLPAVFDFGTVPKWKNDTARFIVKNTSSTKFRFLPIGYSEDLLVLLPKGEIQAGESVEVKLIYYTQTRGNFRRNVPIYVSTIGEPINLALKGKIIDFHPDAMLNCPTLTEDKPKVTTEAPIEIQVVDAISGKKLTGFNLLLKNSEQQQLIETSSRDKVYFDRIKNGKYAVTVSLSGYLTKEEEIVVNRVSRKFVVKLWQDEGPTVSSETPDVAINDEPIVIEKKANEEEEKRDLDKLRERFNEQFKGKKIIEEDVLLVTKTEKDSVTKDTQTVDRSTLPDYSDNGTLNKDKYVSNNLVFLIDVSGSMDKPEKLPYLKKAVKDMVKVLRSSDLVTIIVYSGSAKVVLQGEPGSNKDLIYSVINGLTAKGESHGSEGMEMAYRNAKQNFIPGGNNQVILVSDGLFNSSDFSPKKLYKVSKEKAEVDKIITSAIGFGKDAEAIEFLRSLAINGSGNFIQILSENDASTVLVEEIMKNSMIH